MAQDFQRQQVRFLCEGLSLNRTRDILPAGKFNALTNLRSIVEGELSVRSGTTLITTIPGGQPIHSLARLNDPTPYGLYPAIRVYGASSELFAAPITGPYPPALHDTGYSGNPLTMVPIAPVGAVQPYLYIVDSQRMQKIRVDGTLYPIGLAAPLLPATTVVGPPELVIIDNMNYGNVFIPWIGVGVTTSAPMLVSRVNTTIAHILYDSGSTGNALVAVTNFANINSGVLLNFGSTEQSVVQDVKVAIQATTIAAIVYDSGTTGACTIQPTDGLGTGAITDLALQFAAQVGRGTLQAPPGPITQNFSNVDFPAGCLIQIGSELVRILSVTLGENFLQSFRCTTASGHVVGEAITGIVAIRVYLARTHVIGEAITVNTLAATITPATLPSGPAVQTTGGLQSGVLSGATGPPVPTPSTSSTTGPVVASAGVITGTLDLTTATIEGSSSTIASFAIVAHITGVEFGVNGVSVTVDTGVLGLPSDQGGPGWPDVTPPGFSGPLQYTMGFAFNINGTWYASAVIEMWYGRPDTGAPIQEPGQFPTNYFYSSGQWGPMAGYQPQPGETIGIFIVEGDARSSPGTTPLSQRSNCVLVTMPPFSGAQVGGGGGGGTITPLSLNLGLIGGVPIGADDVFHVSLNLNQALATIVSVQVLFDVDQNPPTFTKNYYVQEFDTSALLAAFSSTPSFAPSAAPGTPGGPALPPGAIGIAVPRGTAGIPDAASLSSGWIELTWTAGQMTKVGVDASRTLANIQAAAVYVTMTAVPQLPDIAPQTPALNVQIGSFYVEGGNNPDIGASGAPYIYTYRPRSTITGEIGNPAPLMRSSDVAPRRQPVTLTPTSVPTDPQTDTIDWFRQGGTLPVMTFVGSQPVGAANFLDDYSDAVVLGQATLDFNHIRPWQSTDKNWSGVVNVAGTKVQWVSGQPFNVNWAPGAEIFINGSPYTLYAQPQSTTLLDVVENIGAFSNVTYQIFQPPLLGAFFPTLWGPVNGVFFAVGDPNNPGRLYWTNTNDPDSTSAPNFLDVCSAAEPLVNGFVWDGVAYVFSTEQLYRIENSPTGVGYVVSLTPCGRGLWATWGFCTTPQGVIFVVKDGICITNTGSPAISLTNDDLYSLFPHDGVPGEPVNGYLPPDFTQLTRLRLSYVDGIVYFDYGVV